MDDIKRDEAMNVFPRVMRLRADVGVIRGFDMRVDLEESFAAIEDMLDDMITKLEADYPGQRYS